MENGAKKEIIIKLKSMRVSLLCLVLVPTWASNCFAGPSITAGSNQQGRTESSDKLYWIRVYVVLI